MTRVNVYSKTVLCILIFVSFQFLTWGQVPPGIPIITAPSFVVEGNSITLSCSSTGGDPVPSVEWHRGDNDQPVDQTSSTSNGITTNDYTFTPTINDHRVVYGCKVNNSILQNNLLATWFFDVYIEPNQPSLTGLGAVGQGVRNEWQCRSTGGRPAPILKMRIENSEFTSGITQSSVLQSDDTYTVTNTLSWAPSINNNGQTLYCDVRHQETRGNNLQTVSLQLTVNAEPNQPTLTGPTTVIFGSTQQWVCVSTGGLPAPIMTLRIENTQFSSGVTQTSVQQPDSTFTVTSLLSWAPNLINHGQTLYCDVQHQQTRGDSLQTVGFQLTVNAEPREPVLSGPTVVNSESVNQWICVSTGGNPAPTITLRIDASQVTSNITQTTDLQPDNTFTVTAVFTWVPSSVNNGQTLYCDVRHPETRGNDIQTANLQLTVNAEPNEPTLIGPAFVILGSSGEWTCVSTGGNPAPTISLRVDNNVITDGLTQNSIQQSDKTYTVTAVLSWTPGVINHGQRLYCDVRHPETRGNNLQTASLILSVYAEPRQPTLTGPSFVALGSIGQWTCVSSGGNPASLISFRVGNNKFTSGITRTESQQADNTYTVISVLSWEPNISYNGQIMYCDVQHQETRGSNLQTGSLDLKVYAEPAQPILTGPPSVIFGSTEEWTCSSSGAFPPPTITIRVGNNELNTGVRQTSILQPDGTYTIVNTLSWAPNVANHGQILYCEVLHRETRGDNPQIVTLQLIVYAEPDEPILTGPSSVVSGIVNQWTCVSGGGNPAPLVSLRIENQTFTSGVSQTSVVKSDNTYNITAVLSWSAGVVYDGQSLYCDVQHEETRGNISQTVSFVINVNAEPNQPTLSGPSTVIFGSNNQWGCISTGGNPAPTITFRIGNTQFTSGVQQTSVLESNNTYTATGLLTWAPNVSSDSQTLYCDVSHRETLGDNLQTVGLQITINAEPNRPTLQGPNVATFGIIHQWTCTSTGGRPAPTLVFRLGGDQFTNGITQTFVLQPDNTYTITLVLLLAPSISDNGKILSCDVRHPETRGSNLQTVSLVLTVNGQPNQPELLGPTTIVLGSTVEWTCFSTGGNPPPTMTLSIGSITFTSGLTQRSAIQPDNTYTILTVLSWTPSLLNSGQTLDCEVRHPTTLGNQVQRASLPLTVNSEPSAPVLIGNTTVIFGEIINWTCISVGGRPAPLMTFRIGNIRLDRNITQSVELQPDNSYTVTSVLSWAPNITNDGRMLHCDVQQNETLGNSSKTASLELTVNAQPNPPVFAGPSTVTLGSTIQWTCVSTGGKPAPQISIRIENNPFNNSYLQSSVLPVDNTFTVTSILSWAPSIVDDRKTLYCDLQHQETLRNSILTSHIQLQINVEPVQPTLTGPSTVIYGTSNQWMCVSTGGKPAPTIIMRIGNKMFTENIIQTSVLQSDSTYTLTSQLTWSPNITDHGQILYCDVQHSETLGNNPQSASLLLTVNVEPNQPVLTGPNAVILGSVNQWICVSTGGRPAPVMSMRIGSNIFTNGTTQTSILQSDKSYTVTMVLSWIPSINHHGQTLYCDVQHDETLANRLQTVGLRLDIYVEPNQPTLTGPTSVTEGIASQWNCISSGGRPVPVVTWRIQNAHITNDITQNLVLQSDNTYTLTSMLSWSPSMINNGQTLYCDVGHQQTRGDDLQIVSLQLTVYENLLINTPQTSFEHSIGTNVILECNITGTPTSVSWYFNNVPITSSGSSKYSNGNTANPSLTISEVALSDAGSYYCQATNGFNTVTSRPVVLSVRDSGVNTGESKALESGEIAAITLAILFILLLILLIICCCCAGYCLGLCGRKKERVTPEPDTTPPVSTLDIPRFYEKSGSSDEYQLYMVKKKKHKKRREPSTEYEFNKYVHLRPDDYQKLESSHITLTKRDSDVDVKKIINPYPSTYHDENEERRCRKQRKKKRKSRHRSDNDGIVVREIIDNGDVLYATTSSRRSERDVLWGSLHADYDGVT